MFTSIAYRSILVVALCFLLQGCAVHFDAINASVPVMMNAKNVSSYKLVTHFSLHQDVQFLFLPRLFGGAKPDINAMIENQLRLTPGDAIINVRIHGDTEVGDFLLPIVIGTAGAFVFPPMSIFIYEPFFYDLKSYTVEGDIIRYDILQQFQAKPLLKIDPMTGLPVEEQKKEFDPETGLPKK
ncbi:MAG: hypothetical protein WDA22_16155 [Bacteroidota bacterium]